MCCSSIEEMEQHSDLVIRGRALAEFDEAKAVPFSQDEYQAYLASGQSLPLGSSVVIHDDKWQLVERFTTVPVEVTEVIEGEVGDRLISVVQYNDWGAIPMKAGSEYLLFLSPSQQPEPVQNLYYNFYGQGTYNIDGTDIRTSSAGYYDADAVEAGYGDRIDFVSLSNKSAQATSITKESRTATPFIWLLNRFRVWFQND